MRILAIDIGSSSIKCGCWRGRAFGPVVRVPFKTRFRGVHAEIDPEEILRALPLAVRQAMDAGDPVDVVSFCTFSPGVVVLNAPANRRTGGAPGLPIITHADRRSVDAAMGLVKQRSKAWWLARTGNLPYPGGIGSSVLAHLRQHTSLIGPGARIGQVSSLVGWYLTGGMDGGVERTPHWGIDPSQAAFLGLWDIRTGQWSKEICELVGVPLDALPVIAPADTVFGAIAAPVARRLGIPAGTPIVGGFIDTGAGIIQTPMIKGQLAHNAGSTDVLAMSVDRPHPAEGLLTRPIGVGGSSTFSNQWLTVRTIASAGSALDWARQTFFPTLDSPAWRKLVAKVSQRASERPTEGTPICLPGFAGARAEMEQAAGATFSQVRLGTTPEQLVEAIVRGLVTESRYSYDRLAAIERPGKVVHVMGGASALGKAMHAAWPKHTYAKVPEDNLRGLVTLAVATMNG